MLDKGSLALHSKGKAGMMKKSILKLSLLERSSNSPSSMDSKETQMAKVEAGLEEHRLQKRLRIINVTKVRAEYQCFLQSSQSKGSSLMTNTPTPPTTPKPTGKEPKREWESSMIRWKMQLRNWMTWWQHDQDFTI